MYLSCKMGQARLLRISWIAVSILVLMACIQADATGIQQDDNYRYFMNAITNGGLRYAVAKHSNTINNYDSFRTKVPPDMKRHVIVVGAGIAGLAAAYELAQVGHKVTILEIRGRVGGRVQTMREGFSEGLHEEAGAMRLPYNHYLTKHYIDLFRIETEPFQNANDMTYVYMYGEKVRMKDFVENNTYYCNRWWKGWDAKLTPALKSSLGINGILDYFDKTIEPVLTEIKQNTSIENWRRFVWKWSKLSVEDFLRTTVHQNNKYPRLRPWPEAAIEAYKRGTYLPFFHTDLAFLLREILGEWWKDPLYAPKHGMDEIPKAFIKKNRYGWNKMVDLSKNIKFGIRVEKVLDFNNLNYSKTVRVEGVNVFTGERAAFGGDAVILTIPLPILRQLDVPLSLIQQKDIANINYEASTKIVLQCKTRFWQKDVGQGGFSKTNLQIGQLRYPGFNNSGISADERGLLLVYTWTKNALTFGAMGPDKAIASAVKQISNFHPEILDQFEVGVMKAWYNDPYAQGAFVALKPFEYIESMDDLTTPTETIYLAGDALSWSNGWIQGALFSGLMQAYAFQDFVENKTRGRSFFRQVKRSFVPSKFRPASKY